MNGDLWSSPPAACRILGIDPRIPEIVRAKFERAQRLYLFGWIDFNLIKAGELAALIALELALMDQYGSAIPTRKAELQSVAQPYGRD